MSCANVKLMMERKSSPLNRPGGQQISEPPLLTNFPHHRILNDVRKRATAPQGPAYQTFRRGSSSIPAIPSCGVRHPTTQSLPLEQTNKETTQSIMGGGDKNKSPNLPPAKDDSQIILLSIQCPWSRPPRRRPSP